MIMYFTLQVSLIHLNLILNLLFVFEFEKIISVLSVLKRQKVSG